LKVKEEKPMELHGLETYSSVPNVARMYDYMLGGKDHFAADRAAINQIIELIPDTVTTAWHNRAFLGRAVRLLAGEAGIRQFIDIGSGLPTMDNVHDVAQRIAPDARTVYVDRDPVVLAHAQALLATGSSVAVIEGDLLDPAAIMGDGGLRNLVDLGKPVAVMLLAVLHFIPDKCDPWGVVGQLMDAVPPGSYLVISHGASDFLSPEARQLAQDVYAATTAGGATSRTFLEISRFFDGLALVDPGLVDIRAWRPDKPETPPERTLFWGGVATKP
jgi:hypothetical protein